MPSFNKKNTETSIRIGEVRFSYCWLFAPRKSEEGKDKYSCCILIPKANKDAVKLINEAMTAAKEAGKTSKWNGKMPPESKLHTPLRDGDEEHPDEDEFAGMWFMNASSATAPGLRVRNDGKIVEALDTEDIYSGCWGAASVNFYPYSTKGNMGVACALNSILKTRDDRNLAGGRSADADFADLAEDDDLLD